jgi:hypothetical protein
MHVFKEWYKRGQLQSVVVEQAKAWSFCPAPGARCEMVAVDEAAAGLVADMLSAGIPARGAKGRVLDGIQAVQNRLGRLDEKTGNLILPGDGKARLTVDPSCENVLNEFESYVWAKDKPKDQPVKENDHAMDALRYLCHALGEATGAWSAADLPPVPRQDPEDPEDPELDTREAFEADLSV